MSRRLRAASNFEGGPKGDVFSNPPGRTDPGYIRRCDSLTHNGRSCLSVPVHIYCQNRNIMYLVLLKWRMLSPEKWPSDSWEQPCAARHFSVSFQVVAHWGNSFLAFQINPWKNLMRSAIRSGCRETELERSSWLIQARGNAAQLEALDRSNWLHAKRRGHVGASACLFVWLLAAWLKSYRCTLMKFSGVAVNRLVFGGDPDPGIWK